MMKEIVLRTLKNLGDRAPDLIAVDGGKGQLDIAHKAMEELGLMKDIVGIAKKPDRAFLLNGVIVDLEDKDRSSLLLKKIRDEVHRFAISFHRKLRTKNSSTRLLPGFRDWQQAGGSSSSGISAVSMVSETQRQKTS